MKILITNKQESLSNNINVLSIVSTEINTSNEVYILDRKEIGIIKYSDTEEVFLIKDLSNKFVDNNQDILINITSDNLEIISNSNTIPLILSKELKMNLLLDQTLTTSGLLIVGKRYVIYNGDLQAGDDFTNVGFVTQGVPFEATGTTPTVWTNGTSVATLIAEIFEFKNTTDTTFTAIINPDSSVIVTFNDAIFLDVNKIFIPSLGNGSWELIDDSNIKFNNLLVLNSLNPIVIEVYE